MSRHVKPFDILLLQDLSGSFSDDIEVVRPLIPGIIEAINSLQANTPIGLSSFVDKPIYPFGDLYSGDFVYRTEQVLTTDIGLIQSTYANLVTGFGDDAPESQLEALLQVVLRASEIGFRAKTTRVVVLFTDSGYHVAGDGWTAGITNPNNLDSVLDGVPPGTGEDYPAIAELGSLLVANNFKLVFAVTEDQTEVYEELLDELGVSGSVVVLENNSLNIAEAIEQGLDDVLFQSFAIESVPESVGIEGQRLWFRIVRSGNTDIRGSVRVTTENSSAKAGSDYQYFSSRVKFARGELSKDIYIDTYQDLAIESDEELLLTISKPDKGGLIENRSAAGLILNKNFNYLGVDGKGQQFQIKDYITVLDTVQEFRRSDPSWGVSFHGSDRPLDLELPTYVYVHGWKDSHESLSSKAMLTALESKNVNTIIVDWSNIAALSEVLRPDKPASLKQPEKSVTATKQVGEAVADFLIKAGFPASSITLIGHSLGSFVAAAAAKEFLRRQGSRVGELVALDNAWGVDYDIDGRNDHYDEPYEFTTKLARSTSSYTASDLSGKVQSSAGDNTRATTAQNAYLVQYARSTRLPGFSWDQAVPIHNGVIGVYADLFRKNMLHPEAVGIERQRFDRKGKPSIVGNFDGVVVSPSPWSFGSDSTPSFKPPKAIGWASSYEDPIINGSNHDDILFFDRFIKYPAKSYLNGLEGNDILVGDGYGIDYLTGGLGEDTFAFGYKRYGELFSKPYVDPGPRLTGYGGRRYAVVTDFNNKRDSIQFAWKKKSIKYSVGSKISKKLAAKLGEGVGFTRRDDLIAYFPGLSLDGVSRVMNDGRLSFGIATDLDNLLFNL